MAWIAGLLMLSALLLPGMATAQTIPQSPACPTETMSVAHGGNAQLNLDHCGLFGVGPIGTQATHGTATFSNLGAALVTYTHVGGSNVATSDFFTIADENGAWIWITVTIAAPTSSIAIAPTTLPSMVAGTAFSQALSASGGTAPYTYSITGGSLPTGLSMTAAGLISGTPTQRGPFAFTVGVSDAVSDTGSRGYSVTVAPGTLSLSPNPPANAILGLAYSASFTASGGVAPYQLMLEPDGRQLPPGLSFGGATLSGTPTALGTYTFGIRVTDASTGPGVWFQVFDVTITVSPPPTITVAPATLPGATAGSAYSQTIAGGGGTAPYTYAVTAGTLPGGLALSTSTGALSGTPTAGGSFNFTIRATDNNGFSGSRAYAFSVAAATIALAPATLPAATVGSAYTQAVTASGGTAPYAYAITAGALPAGLTLASNGTLSGTATAGGTFNFTVTATDSSSGSGPYTGSRAYAFTVGAPTVALAPASLPAATIATAYSQGVSASGGTAPYSYAVTAGALPAGLTLASDGTLSGTATSGGSFNFTVTATDSSTGSGPFTGSNAYALSVDAPTVTLAPATLPGGTLDVAYNQTVIATGGTAPYTYAITAGALPAGLTLAANGTLSGTPTALGLSNFTITATDSSGGSGPFAGSQGYSVEITGLPPVANAVSATVAYGSGANAITLDIGGGAPASVAVTAPGNGSALATGTSVTYQPDAGHAGADSFTYTATNSAGTSAAATVSITVSAPTINVTAADPLTIVVGSAYTQTFTWSGGAAPYSGYTVTGLPAGLAITASNTSSVTVSGTPTEAGTFALVAAATDNSTGIGPFTQVGNFALEVSAPTPTLSPAAGVLDASYATAYTQAFTASGGVAPYSFSLSGTLPAGLVFDTSAGVLSGTTVETGSFPITVAVTDSSTGVGAPFSASSNYTIQIAAPTVTIAPATLPDGTSGTAYSQTLLGSGGIAPYTFSVGAGALPTGLTLSASGELTGTPTAAGPFNFTVAVEDANAQPGSVAYGLTIDSATLVLSPGGLPNGTAASAYDVLLSASGGVAPYSYAITGGTLPAGLALDAGGSLSGTPTAAGTFNFAATVTDSSGPPSAATRAYALTIDAPVIIVAPPVLADGTVGVAYNQSVTASGGAGGYIFAINGGTLPPGLELSAAGALTGTPTAEGNFGFSVTATDSLGFGGTTALTIAVVDTAAVPQGIPQALTTLAGQVVVLHAADGASGGPFTGLTVITAPASGTLNVMGTDLEYTPSADDAGTVSIGYTLENAFGSSALITSTVMVNPLPVASSQEVSTVAGVPVQVELTTGAVGGPFTAADVVSISPESSGTATVAAAGNGDSATFLMTFTPAVDFSGAAIVTFNLSNAFATSQPAAVTVNVAARPDPSRDAEVLGVLNAQADAARRFATAQIGNFQQRLRGLHDGGANAARFSNQLGFTIDRNCNDAVQAGLGRSCATSQPADDQATAADAAAALTEAPPFAIWTGGALSSGDRARRDGSNALSFETSGVSAGADYRANEAFALGAGLGYGRDRTDVGENGSRSDADNRTVAFYASYHPGETFFLDGLVGHQWMSFDSRRHVAANGGSVQGDRDGTQWFASVSAGLDHHRDQLSLSPYARLDVSRARLDGYTEQGDPIFALRVAGQDVDSTTGNLGLDVDYRHPVSWGTFAPNLRLEYQHDFQDEGTATLSYADLLAGPVFRANLNGFDRNRFLLGIGARFYARRDLTLRVEYRSLLDSDDEQSLLFNLEKKY